MFELSRVRLHSIGPPGARFADVLVDFSGVGPPVSGHRQDLLFTEAVPAHVPTHVPTQDGGDAGPGAIGAARPRRPSPASVLFLENGGGKSVLIKLIFSVVLPGRRHVVGTSNGRVLDNFVLPRDTGHVVCEWQHAVTGERVVTGKVSEWRGRAAADAPRLAEAWYSFRPSTRLGVTALPLTDGGRLVTLAGFRSRLTDAAAADPALDLIWETSQGAWSEHLDALGLDPELFRYQRAMNAGEGEAAEAFSFTTDEQFVDFLLRAVTPPEDPAGIADVLDGYAAKLADRAVLAAEREFVAGALDRLGPLSEAMARRATAERSHQAVRAEIAALRVAVRARLERDAGGLAGLTASADAAREAERDAETERGRRHDHVLALRRRTAELRLTEAERERDRLVAAARDAGREIDAWRATDDVLRLAAASAEAARLTRLVSDAENLAAPALADRDEAARALLRGLRALATASSAAADEAEARAADHELAAGDADAADRRASDEAARARAREQALRDRIDDAAASLATAVEAGLVPAGRIDLPAQARLAATAARTAAAAVRDALTVATRAQDRREVEASTRTAEQASAAAGAAVARLTTELARARDSAEALLAGGRIAALLGLDEPAETDDTAETDETDETDERRLDRLAETALDRLGEAVQAAEQRRLELSLAADVDRRVLGALGEGDLRPPRDEVTAAVACLRAAGIAAVAGWSHLAFALTAAEQARVLATRPYLVDGVVVTDRTAWPRAREVLEAARLLPDGAVAVGDVEALLAREAPVIDGERVLLVPPNPALYDTAAAASERAAIRARQDERTALAAELAARIEADRDLAATLTAWRRTHPVGATGRRHDELAAARAADDAARAALGTAARAASAAEQAAQAALADVEPLRAAAQEAADRAAELDQLARSVGDPVTIGREIEREAVQAEEHVARALAARERAGSQRRAAAEAVRRADAARRAAADARTESAAVIGAGGPEPPGAGAHDAGAHDAGGGAEPPGGGRPGTVEEPPAPPVAVLRAAYEAANRTYAQVEVGADLRGDVDRARRDEAAARAATDALDPEVRARAAALLAGTSGGDAAARAAGEAQARRRAGTIGAELDDSRERLGGLREELRQAGAEVQRRGVLPLTGDLVPTGLDHALELMRAATAAVDEAEARHARTRADRERLVELSTRQSEGFDALQAVAETLLDLPADGAPGADASTDAGTGTGTDATADHDLPAPGAVAVPFGGEPHQAREESRRLRAAWREAATRYAEAAAAVRTAADAVASWAARDRFDAVRTPARRQMIKSGREAVAEGAAVWAAALAPRLRSLDDDLAHIGRNRSAIVARLEGLVRAALGTLRAAGRLSRLPDQLGDWSGQEFLRVTFAEPADLALTEALGTVVDETAELVVGARTGAGHTGSTGNTGGTDAGRARAGERRPGRTATAIRRDGMGLLLRGVRAALPRGVRVEILKPDAVLRTERVRVSELGDVFSGGQQLTAAIILYCTMAALRANDRGHLRAPHAGVLFLDNPIGRASAAYLLDLQLAVADRLGVQLVYTTGLFDTSALSAFPLIVRLRNDADLRAGLKYLRVEEHLRPGLTPVEAGAPGATVTGVVTATRLHSRPGTPSPSPDGRSDLR